MKSCKPIRLNSLRKTFNRGAKRPKGRATGPVAEQRTTGKEDVLEEDYSILVRSPDSYSQFYFLKKDSKPDMNGKRPTTSFYHPTLDSINAAWENGTKDIDQAHKEINELHEQIYRKRDALKPREDLFYS